MMVIEGKEQRKSLNSIGMKNQLEGIECRPQKVSRIKELAALV